LPFSTTPQPNPDGSTRAVTLHPTEGFYWKQSLEFVDDSGATNHLDQIAEDFSSLARPLRLGTAVYWITLTGENDGTAVRLALRAPDDADPPSDDVLDEAVAWANRRFFMDVEMDEVENALKGDKYGAELLTRFFPARPANYPSAWEALIKSVVHMQIYPGFAAQLDDYLCRNYGTTVTFDGETFHMVPTPAELLAAIPDDLRAAKFSRQKADFLTTIPFQIKEEPEKFDFEAMRERDPDESVQTLKELHGVGDWVAQNVVMRGLPHTDLFIDEKTTRAALTPVYGKADNLGKRAMRDAVARFSPYRSFACYYTYMKHFDM